MLSFTIIDDLVNFLKPKKRKSVLITGFGPFIGFVVNPSWEAVKYVQRKITKKNLKIKLYKEQIPVRYVAVDLIVPKLLDTVKPDLTIHVGVSTEVKCLVLETQAKKQGYIYEDVGYHLAAQQQNPSPGPNVVFCTELDIDAIRDQFNELEVDLRAEKSDDARGYLCEYIYYTSLSLKRCPTLFVHVPPETYTTEQLARGLERIIELCVNQLDTATNMKAVRM